MKPRIRDLWASNVDAKPRDFDFSQGYGEVWEYHEATHCQECGKVVLGYGGEEQHNVIDTDTDCEGWVSVEGPMMNYFYPVDLREGIEEAAKKIAGLPLCLVTFNDTEETVLTLSGGGMDLSWEICEAYMLLGLLPPHHFCNLPHMAGRGTSAKDRWIISACRKSAKVSRNDALSTIRHLRGFVKTTGAK